MVASHALTKAATSPSFLLLTHHNSTILLSPSMTAAPTASTKPHPHPSGRVLPPYLERQRQAASTGRAHRRFSDAAGLRTIFAEATKACREVRAITTNLNRTADRRSIECGWVEGPLTGVGLLSTEFGSAAGSKYYCDEWRLAGQRELPYRVERAATANLSGTAGRRATELRRVEGLLDAAG
ncbi:uncharacterized protein BDZ99DRAFT_518081 [Mytilinidion resinicola]|uniref:Uncharacterized protein n=1 Tax=Mytilinidion resinicola TaxID=574789 RepID=A0A6A6YTE7_9PEZI|nr:uncharacterized protein BDZ99DRAFT_518081 [Mytilinidion resinicola]KAF2812226.1 hypothetical protein BDZ99DRAFT_518081 [Mytilinidion resinicola]